MNMIVMVGIFLLIFFTSVVVMCHYRDKMDPKVWNPAFVIADIIVYFCWTYAGYERGWIDEGWMTLENISPMLCTVVLLTPIMNDKVKQAAYDTIALFTVGLFIALMVSPEHAYLAQYKIEANFLYTSEAACHLVVATFGAYLVLSGQVKPGLKSWKRTLIFTYSIIGTGVILNYIFHKTFFGMNPYGSSSIYMIDLFASHEATLLAYLFGVLIVITVGMQVMYGLNRAVHKAYASEAGVRCGRERAVFEDGAHHSSATVTECESAVKDEACESEEAKQ